MRRHKQTNRDLSQTSATSSSRWSPPHEQKNLPQESFTIRKCIFDLRRYPELLLTLLKADETIKTKTFQLWLLSSIFKCWNLNQFIALQSLCRRLVLSLYDMTKQANRNEFFFAAPIVKELTGCALDGKRFSPERFWGLFYYLWRFCFPIIHTTQDSLLSSRGHNV